MESPCWDSLDRRKMQIKRRKKMPPASGMGRSVFGMSFATSGYSRVTGEEEITLPW